MSHAPLAILVLLLVPSALAMEQIVPAEPSSPAAVGEAKRYAAETGEAARDFALRTAQDAHATSGALLYSTKSFAAATSDHLRETIAPVLAHAQGIVDGALATADGVVDHAYDDVGRLAFTATDIAQGWAGPVAA